jgi:hypothetical protein
VLLAEFPVSAWIARDNPEKRRTASEIVTSFVGVLFMAKISFSVNQCKATKLVPTHCQTALKSLP